MYHSDISILQLIEILIFQKKVKNTFEFCTEIGFYPQNMPKLKNGKTHFTPEQIRTVCLRYNVNANWIFGTEKRVFNSADSIDFSVNFDNSLPTM